MLLVLGRHPITIRIIKIHMELSKFELVKVKKSTPMLLGLKFQMYHPIKATDTLTNLR